MIYTSVSGHAILSGKGKALFAENPTGFAAQQELAESLLGFAEPAVTDATLLTKASMAIALQINWQLETQLDPYIYTSLGSAKLNQNRTYRDDLPLVSPHAAELAAVVLTPTFEDELAGWGSFRSHRGPQS